MRRKLEGGDGGRKRWIEQPTGKHQSWNEDLAAQLVERIGGWGWDGRRRQRTHVDARGATLNLDPWQEHVVGLVGCIDDIGLFWGARHAKPGERAQRYTGNNRWERGGDV